MAAMGTKAEPTGSKPRTPPDRDDRWRRVDRLVAELTARNGALLDPELDTVSRTCSPAGRVAVRVSAALAGGALSSPEERTLAEDLLRRSVAAADAADLVVVRRVLETRQAVSPDAHAVAGDGRPAQPPPADLEETRVIDYSSGDDEVDLELIGE